MLEAQAGTQVPVAALEQLLGVRRVLTLAAGERRVGLVRRQHDEALRWRGSKIPACEVEARPRPGQRRAERHVHVRCAPARRERSQAVRQREVAAPAERLRPLGERQDVPANRHLVLRQRHWRGVGERLALAAGLVRVAVEDAVLPAPAVADAPRPSGADQRAVLLLFQQLAVFEVVGFQHVFNVSGHLLGRVQHQKLELVVRIDAGVRLEDEVRHHRAADVVFADELEQSAEIELAQGGDHRGVLAQAARAVVDEFGAGEIQPHAGGRAWISPRHVEFQHRTVAPAIGRAPAAGGELRPGDQIGREDRESAAAFDVFPFAERAVEVDHFVVGESVHQNQVVARAPAAHGEVGEVAFRDQPRQAVQRAQYVRAAAGGGAQRLAVQKRGADAAIGVFANRAGHHDDFIAHARAQHELHRNGLVPHHAHRRLNHLNVARVGRHHAVEASAQAQHGDAARVRGCLPRAAIPRLGDDADAGQRLPFLREHGNAQGARVIGRGLSGLRPRRQNGEQERSECGSGHGGTPRGNAIGLGGTRKFNAQLRTGRSDPLGGQARLVLAEKRIAYRQRGKAAEVAIRSPKLRDAVGEAQGGDLGIVNHWPRDSARGQLALQNLPMRVGLGQQSGHRRRQPCIDLGGGLLHRRRRIVDPRVRHDGQELMHAGPRQAPKHTPRRQRPHTGAGLGMPLRVLSVGIDEDIRVDGDQPPLPS